MKYFAFLRAINAGVGRTIKMEALRHAFEGLGFSGVETFIASGNVVFETFATDASMLEKLIEQGLKADLGIDVPVFIRTKAELAEIAGYQPFQSLADDPTGEIFVIFLAGTLDDQVAQKMTALTTESDAFHVHGREIYWLRHPHQEGPPYSTAAIEKTIGRSFSIRGAKTIRKMIAKFVHI